MKTYPLKSISFNEARSLQFRLTDIVTKHFRGAEILTRGDLGLNPLYGKPETTRRVEEVIADFFGQEASVLVRGAGTGAIAAAFRAVIAPGRAVLIHAAPVYPTTMTTISMMNLSMVRADYNTPGAAGKTVLAEKPDAALVQLARQKPDDIYDHEAVIQELRSASRQLPIIADDNYAVMKVSRIGAQCGADLSCFSLFKLLGPEGIGCVTGRSCYIRSIERQNYSGGSQVQGHEALEVLLGLVYAPVALAIQSEVVEEVVVRLNQGEVAGVAGAFAANAQSKVIIVELEQPVAEEVLLAAESFGAAPFPVGSESRYEIVPLFYRVSGTFLQSDKTLEKRMIRINPMRAGTDTVISILSRSLKKITG